MKLKNPIKYYRGYDIYHNEVKLLGYQVTPHDGERFHLIHAFRREAKDKKIKILSSMDESFAPTYDELIKTIKFIIDIRRDNEQKI